MSAGRSKTKPKSGKASGADASDNLVDVTGGELQIPVDDQLPLALDNVPAAAAMSGGQQQVQRPAPSAQQWDLLKEQVEQNANTMRSLARALNGVRGESQNLEHKMDARLDDIMRAISGVGRPAQPTAPVNNNPPPANAGRREPNLLDNPIGQNEFQPQQVHPRTTGLFSQEAMAKSILQNIDKLDGTNYETWAKKVAGVVEMQQLSEHIERNILGERPHCAQTRSSDRALYLIMESLIADTYLDRLELAEETCFCLWQQLSRANAHQLNQHKESDWIEFVASTRSGHTQSIGEYCDRAITLYARLKRRAITVDELFLYSFLGGLPDAKFFRTQLGDEGVTFTEQIEIIRRKHSQQAAVTLPSICTAQRFGRARSGERARSPKSPRSGTPARIRMNEEPAEEYEERDVKGACFKCGKFGHHARMCRFKSQVSIQTVQQEQSDERSGSESDRSGGRFSGCVVERPEGSDSDADGESEDGSDLESEGDFSLGVLHINQSSDREGTADRSPGRRRDRWLLDTGSSVHICNDIKWFVGYQPYEREFGGCSQGSTLRAEAKGTVRFRLQCGREMEIQGVYYCPNAVMNLLTNVGLSQTLQFTVDSRETWVTHQYGERVSSFPFAAVERGQNRVLVDYSSVPEDVLTTTRTRARLPDGEEHRQRSRGRPASQPNRQESANRPNEPAASAESSPRRGRGRPRKQRPPSEPVDRQETSAAPEGQPEASDQQQAIEEFLEEECEEADGRLAPDRDGKAGRRMPRRLRDLMPMIAQRNRIRTSVDVHRHHGHIGVRATSEMCRLYRVPDAPINCRLCQVQNLDHHVQTGHRLRTVKKPLELIYMDVVQPYKRNIEAYDGTTCALTILDDKTGFVKLYNLKSRDQVYECFEDYMRKAERLHNRQIIEIRTDGGTEFLGPFVGLEARTGINHTFTAPYVHENAARIERLNRTLEDRADKLLRDSGLSVKYFPLAMKRAEQLYNRTIDTHGRMPYCEWFDNVDDHLSFVFGEEVAYLYYANHTAPVRGSGRIVAQGSQSKTYSVLLPNGEILNKIFFVKRLPSKESSGSAAQVNSVFDQESGESRGDRREESVLDVCVMQVVRRKREALHESVPVPGRFADIEGFGGRWRRYWYNRVRSELESMIEMGVFTPVRREGIESKPLGTRGVYTCKEGEGKVRIVARGDRQTPDSYDDTFSPTMSIESLRMLLKLALEHELTVHTIDIKRAYLNARLEEEVYIELPEGYELVNPDLDRGRYVLRLNRALYGLKQAGLAWYREINGRLRELGFDPLPRCPTIFKHREESGLIIGLYVDDCVLLGRSELRIQQLKDQLRETYDLHDGGPIDRILGIDITAASGSYDLSLARMIDELCQKHNIAVNPKVRTPLPAGSVIDAFENSPSVDYEIYASLVGSLLYIARMTRPDILAAVGQLGQFQSAPRRPHYRRLLGILYYLAATRDVVYSICRTGRVDVEAHSDSSLANTHDRCSLFGAVFLIGGSPIAFYSRKNRTITPSINESEIVAAYEAFRDLTYFARVWCCLVHGPGGERAACGQCPAPVLHVDNTGVLSFAKKGLSKRTRYIDIEYLALKQRLERADYELRYVESSSNRADGFTKNLSAGGLADFRGLLGLSG